LQGDLGKQFAVNPLMKSTIGGGSGF
jgi:hypothetical protein